MHYRIASVAALALILSGCSTPQHTNLLIFGTNTVVGLKVGADATQTPAIQVGYTRQELVLMPLLANTSGTGDKLAPCPSTVVGQTPPPTVPVNCKFIGQKGADNIDSYSVLASFGAKFDAKKVGTDAEAGGAIAQYFATGLAARELARHGSSLVAASESATADALSSAYSEAQAAAVVDRAYKGREGFASAVEKLADPTFKQMLSNADDAASAGNKLVRACSTATTAADCAKALRLDDTLSNFTGERWQLAINGLK